MLPEVEFGVGDVVNYKTTVGLQRAVVKQARLNPVDNIVEYKVSYAPQGKKSAIFMDVITADKIRESKFFKG